MLDSSIHMETVLSPLFESGSHGSKETEDVVWKRPAVYEFPIRSFPLSASTVFAMERWFGVLQGKDVKSLERHAIGRIDFIRNVFALVSPTFPNDVILQNTYLLFESLANPQSAYKLAKNLLKNDRMNLGLWNAYAQSELLRGKVDEARRVYMNSIPLSLSSKALMEESSFLYRMLAELELRVNPARAVAVILASAEQQSNIRYDEFDDKTYPATRILKAQNVFGQQISQMLQLADASTLLHPTKSPLHLVYLKSLLENLVSSIEVACETYQGAISVLGAREESLDLVTEMLYEDCTHIIHRHMLSSDTGFRPSVLRNMLERALEKFPHNIIFHSLYVLNESRTQIEGRVKKMLHDAESKHPSHVIWSFHLWTELQLRPQRNLHYIRSIFENALSCSTSRHSVALWYNYFLFELQEANYEKAKRIVSEAVVACPWSKEMALLAVERLGGILNNDEISAMVEIMKRRDLRIRQSVDDYNLVMAPDEAVTEHGV
ncbi:hypothetical protein SeLEV6574_g00602 [Synchytrium endobioticum]|uniref:Suppressor of forked domain-containing protein n=1 Tax=Synchytrium endobioticum TaxID=286115 RepID=A0A507DH30_9FUNG|nr:hypothetical protein SeLEV6574_g00602 [Synchytrium endobioticum]